MCAIIKVCYNKAQFKINLEQWLIFVGSPEKFLWDDDASPYLQGGKIISWWK